MGKWSATWRTSQGLKSATSTSNSMPTNCRRLLDTYCEEMEQELKEKKDTAAATLKSAQDAHADAMRQCNALARHQRRMARNLREDYREANGDDLPDFPDPHEVEQPIEWMDVFDDDDDTPSSDAEDDEEVEEKEEKPKDEPQLHIVERDVAEGVAAVEVDEQVAVRPVFKVLAALGNYFPAN
ncbi:unnamed protein product, partial [Mesorhabditis spiculigera]